MVYCAYVKKNVFYKSKVIRKVIRSGKGGQVNDKKIAIVPYVTNGKNSQVGHDGHFNIFKKNKNRL